MNTNTLKKFAQETRIRLIKTVTDKLNYVLTGNSAELLDYAESIKKLKEDLNQIGQDALIDKVAYTWFNRLMALRFMDANDYQPLRLKVVSPKPGFTQPEILDEVAQGNIPEELQVDRQKINDLLDGKITSPNPQNEVYRLLLIASCNHLHGLFPFLFEKLKDYTELLLPDDLISELSIIQDFVNGMTEEDCQETEMIGWLYQFYISERKDEVFAAKGKVEKEDIPAATQLFTPRWIVEYMVQNTVGKLWLQNNPRSELKDKMPYYIETESSKSDDFLKIDSPEEITLLDQACGSGHILVYGFELLYQIYEEAGYTASQIPQLIIEKNLYGAEIDERAAQLSSFSILMKARSYYRRLFRKPLQPHILQYCDLLLREEEIKNAFDELGENLTEDLLYDFRAMQQATNLGSLIQPRTNEKELKKLFELLTEKKNSNDIFLKHQVEELRQAVGQLIQLTKKHSCIVDNPPYMGGGNMNKPLSDYVRINYPDSKADLMACFMESGLEGLKKNGLLGMINQHSWMFLSSYEKLREKLIDQTQFDTLLHLGPRTFPEIGGEVVQNAAFTFVNKEPVEKSSYIRLVDYKDTYLKSDKTIEAIQYPNCGWFYTKNQKDFKKIPGSNIGYWVHQGIISLFDNSKKLSEIIFADGQNKTGNNEKYLRLLWEINKRDLGIGHKFIFYAKGGHFRKWHGNIDFSVKWDSISRKFYSKNKIARIIKKEYWYREGFTFSRMAKKTNGRVLDKRGTFDATTISFYIREKEAEKYNYLLGLFNSVVVDYFIKILNPTLVFQLRDVRNIPFKNTQKDEIPFVVKENISISKQEWNSRETSWDFKQNELIRLANSDLGLGNSEVNEQNTNPQALSTNPQQNPQPPTPNPQKPTLIKEAIDLYKAYWSKKFYQLHQNEEELNKEFIHIYGLEEDLTPDIPLTDITLLKDELKQKKLKALAEGFNSGWELVNGKWGLGNRDLGLGNNEEENTNPQPLTTNHQPPALPFDTKELIKQLISYAVGCMMGRYSLEKEGLILANQGETLSDYRRIVDGDLGLVDSGKSTNHQPLTTNPQQNPQSPNPNPFNPDQDAIIPVLDTEWFTDDIVTQFKDFLKAVWGENERDRNYSFIEKTLGKSVRDYFYKDFYKDHIKRYKKRPIYWLFSSSSGAFQVLVYLYRYTSDTLNGILNNYLRPYIDKLENHIEHLNQLAVEGSAREQTQAKKDIAKTQKMIAELRKYDKEVLYPLALERIELDLDDGVLVNYNKMGSAVKTVTSLNDKKKKKAVRKFDWIDTAEIRD